MTWFFAFLIVIVMGVVAVVASGRGGSMAETYDDRPDSRVQADGPLTAEDLRKVRFSTAFRGYRMSEVDSLLDRLAVEMAPAPQARPHEPEAAGPADPADRPESQAGEAAGQSAEEKAEEQEVEEQPAKTDGRG